jgi:hypothetical protein
VCLHHALEGKRGIRIQQINNLLKQNVPMLIVATVLLICVMTAPTFGVTVETLKAPVKDLKDTIFGGWMWVPKIGAAVGGCLMAVYNQSIMPLATGAGVGLGIHFYELYINADAALI